MSFSEQDIAEFKAEALELLDVAEKALLTLDQGGDFCSAFDAVFRGFHNLKGAAGMMEMTLLQSHTHGLENILMGFKGQDVMSKEYISLFLRGVDAARQIIDGQTVHFDFKVAATTASAASPATAGPVPSPEPIAPHVTLTSVVVAAVAAPAVTTAPVIADSTLNEFVTECGEIIERVSKGLQLLEKGAASKDVIDALYRDVHSLKGSAYLFSFNLLGDVGHAMESSLETVRAGTHVASLELLNALFKSLQVIENLVKRIAAQKPDADLAEEVPTLNASLQTAFENLQRAPVTESLDGSASPGGLSAATNTNAHANANGNPASTNVAAGPTPEVSEGASSIRVPISLLDSLMTLMGEMVLVRNQVLQYASRSEDLEFLSMSKRLNVVTSEIQGEMMKTRMQPIGNVLGKFNRVVRDLSQELRKTIHLNISGADTELDKSLLEAIKDPLTHIVRNSCDHGIEIPEVRRQSNKREAGTISIRAYHEGGQVVVEVSDDGKGLNKETLLKKALEKSLITPAQATSMTEKEIFNLIFAPGFSTAAKVTNVSGRGVGMDVVRTNIERIGGTVDLTAAAGQGTTLRLKIPLTLAIVPALIVKCGSGKFAVPQVKLEELVRVDQSSKDNRIEILHGTPVYRLRGNILPLVDLNSVLAGKAETAVDLAQYRDAVVNIAVLNAEQFSFGLIIDEIQDSADIVVKPLTRLMKSLHVYSGATILGDGSVALILDVLGISKVAQLRAEKVAAVSAQQSAEITRRQAEMQDFLLMKLNSTTKHALALAYVHRLEEFKTADIEHTGAQSVIRYRDHILPLLWANRELGLGASENLRPTIAVVVIQRAGDMYGIVVDEILDTLATTCETKTPLTKQNGIFGNLNTEKELIVVIDPFELINSAFPGTGKVEFKSKVTTQAKRILVVEDTAFFRRNIKKILEENGYVVATAIDGEDALEILASEAAAFDIIVSDIEMPRVNGFQFASSVRRHPTYSTIPMLAVSSRADKAYLEEGAKAGFNLYLEKLKPEILLNAIDQLIHRRAS